MADETRLQKKLAKELGLDNLPQDKQQKLLIKMTEALLKRIFLETMEKLDEKGRTGYQKLVEQGAEPQKIEDFLESNIHNYENIIQGVIDDFKEEMKKRH